MTDNSTVVMEGNPHFEEIYFEVSMGERTCDLGSALNTAQKKNKGIKLANVINICSLFLFLMLLNFL